jgi:anti-sigma regulatory factor (Ser/Thr protein kinase)
MPYHRCADCGLTGYSAASHTSARVCPTCAAPLSDATRVYVAPGATRTINRGLVARLEAGAEARREIVSLPVSQEARAQLALLVSELVNNAVLHADTAAECQVSLKVRLRSGRVRVEVSDSGSGFDAPALLSPDPLAIGGQGLLIVAALSDSWGVLRGPKGCTVWCEVLVEEPADVAEHEVTGAYLRELAVGPEEVVPFVEASDRGSSAEGAVWSLMVVAPEPAVKRGGPFAA